ncbi:MAG: hypothetical protein NC302_03150 [Bacteroidales bacterium]|nr:hypothetical protein [Bacteroidales bacterium]MCM1414914.1 hypothetical protein [bacterium]MCM1423063.1 hypothetical protein [bacterium]
MSEWKKLFQVRRILAVALAAAMAVTSAPVTAQAASDDPTAAGTTADQETDISDAAKDSKTEDSEGGSGDALPAEDDEAGEDGDAAPAADGGAGTDAADAQAQEDDKQDADAAGAEQQTSGSEAEPQAETAVRQYRFVYEWDNDYDKQTQFEYGYEWNEITYGGKLNDTFLDRFRLAGIGEENVADYDLGSDLNSEGAKEILGTITYQWFEGDKALDTPRKLNETGVNPMDVGDYKLVLKLPAKAGADGYAEATGEFPFSITKASATVFLNNPAQVKPGTAVTAVPLPAIGSIYSNDRREFAKSDVKVTPIIKDAETDAVLTEGTLTADKEYIFTAAAEFVGDNKTAYDKNYSLGVWFDDGMGDSEVKLTIGSLKETRLNVTLDRTKYPDSAKVTADVEVTGGGRTVQVVEVQKIADAITGDKPAFNANLEEKTADAPEKWETLTQEDSLFESVWYTVVDYSVPKTAAGKTTCDLTLGGILDAAPTATGAYVYRYSYKGDQKEYAECYADILVIVEIPEIIVQPTVAEGAVFRGGQSIEDVLAQIDYELPYADGRTADGKAQTYPKAEDMWGVLPGAGTQFYQPEFELIEVAKDGTETTYKAGYRSGSNVLPYDKDAKYYVRFNGNKTVYDLSGKVYYERGSHSEYIYATKAIMDGVDSMDPDTCGFKVVTDADVNKQHQVEITVAAKGSMIVTDEITKKITESGMSSEKVKGLDFFTKTYDGQRIFLNHADYKKAQLKSGETTEALAGTDLTYGWYESWYSYDELTAADSSVTAEELKSNWRGPYGMISPVDAGVYRLRITNSMAEPADLYFVIKKQELTLDLSAELKTNGITIYVAENDNPGSEQFIINRYFDVLEGGSSLAAAADLEGKPTRSEDWKNWALFRDADYAYRVDWGVYEKQTQIVNGQEVDQKDESGKTVYERYQTGQITRDAGKYAIKATAVSTLGNANNFMIKDGWKDLVIPITVKDMGTKEIRFAGVTPDAPLEIEKTYDGESVYSLIQDKLAAYNAPITLKADGKTKDTDVTGVELTYTVEREYSADIEERTYTGQLPVEAEEWDWTKDSGTYKISVWFMGNDEYAFCAYDLAVITVYKRGLTLVLPALEKTYETGEAVKAALDDAETAFKALPNAGLKGDIVEADREYFTRTILPNGEQGFPVWYRYNEDADPEEGESEWEYYAPAFQIYDVWGDAGEGEGYSYYNHGENTTFLSTAGNRYTLRLDYDYYESEMEVALSGSAAVNYYVSYTETDPASTPIKVSKGAARVLLNGGWLDSTDKISDGTAPIVKEHQVTVQDAIPYVYSYVDSPGDDEHEGNIVTIGIELPKEYWNESSEFYWSQASYEKSIKDSAGENLIGSINLDPWEYEGLSFVYNATSAIANGEDLTFSIRWKADHVEKFTILFSKAEALGDLRNAVAPKSLAFNGALTSMVVGQEQELDVKITKEQMSDVICLGYQVTAGGEGSGGVLHVNERGKVTALKEGKATVEVFPMRLVNGKRERIEKDAKGKAVKTAKVNITVKKVIAPKISKVTAHDDYAVVQYALPNKNDGYRREIYVMEGKNVKAQTFETAIAGMKNGRWQGSFVTAPIFVTYQEESKKYDRDRESGYRVYDSKKAAWTNTVAVPIDGLTPGKKDYTVYVRSVSKVRSLEDDCKVTLCGAGNTKSFATTLTEASGLIATLKGVGVAGLSADEYDSDAYTDYTDRETLPTADEIRDQVREAVKDERAVEIVYEVPLSKKSVQLSLEALFLDAAEDAHYEELALKGDAKKKYANPKLSYYFVDYMYDGYDAYNNSHITEGYGNTTKSGIGTIAKNGKVTLKGVGEVRIRAIDTASGLTANSIRLRVTAKATGITARKAKMEVGQRIKLTDLVDYKEGKTKLGQNYNDNYAGIDVQAAKASLGENSHFTITDDGYLVAESVGSAQFTLTDRYIEGSSATIKATAKALSGVKNLNAVDVLDKRFDVRFEMNPYAEAYRINIKDARGSLIRGIYVENLPFNYTKDGKTQILWDGENKTANGWNASFVIADESTGDGDDDWGTQWVDWYDGYRGSDDEWSEVSFDHPRENWYAYNSSCYANAINGKMNLTYRIGGLTQSSKYTVEVTTLYKEQQSGKPVTKTVSTTKLPAYDYVITSKLDPDVTYAAGMEITLKDGKTLISEAGFVSGNTYSLAAKQGNGNDDGGYHAAARYAGTDTLTWSSSNKKVATVTPTSGGYSASLKALKDGETVIEVRSAVRKGVIARYTIHVSTVGDAYLGNDYYGENEELRGDSDDTPTKDPVVVKMTVGKPVAVDWQGGAFRFEFTALEAGTYQLCKIEKGQTSVLSVRADNTWDGVTIRQNMEVSGKVPRVVTGYVMTNEKENLPAFNGRLVIKKIVD